MIAPYHSFDVAPRITFELYVSPSLPELSEQLSPQQRSCRLRPSFHVLPAVARLSPHRLHPPQSAVLTLGHGTLKLRIQRKVSGKQLTRFD